MSRGLCADLYELKMAATYRRPIDKVATFSLVVRTMPAQARFASDRAARPGPARRRITPEAPQRVVSEALLALAAKARRLAPVPR